MLENPHQALIRVNQLLGDHRYAPETANAHNVKGDVQLMLGEGYDTVKSSYLRARTAATQFGSEHAETGAYALKQLISLAKQDERWEEAIGYFEEFGRQYGESRWRTDATVPAVDALVEKDRAEEALSALEALVSYEADRGNGPELERAVKAYSAFLLEHVPAEERMRKLEGFAAARKNPGLEGMLLIGQIEAEEATDGEVDQERVGQLFGELESLFGSHGPEMTGYSLVRLGRWRGAVQGDAGGAMRVFDEVLQRKSNGESYGMALSDSAALLASQKGKSEQARERFLEALDVTDSTQVKEQAVLGLARLATRAKKWEVGEQRWLEYLDQKDWLEARPEANFGYATCLDGSNQREEALKVYISVYANFPGELDLSTNAYLRASEILWNSGRQLDALKVLQDMLRRMEGEDHPNVAKAETRFFQWRDQYVASQN